MSRAERRPTRTGCRGSTDEPTVAAPRRAPAVAAEWLGPITASGADVGLVLLVRRCATGQPAERQAGAPSAAVVYHHCLPAASRRRRRPVQPQVDALHRAEVAADRSRRRRPDRRRSRLLRRTLADRPAGARWSVTPAVEQGSRSRCRPRRQQPRRDAAGAAGRVTALRRRCRRPAGPGRGLRAPFTRPSAAGRAIIARYPALKRLPALVVAGPSLRNGRVLLPACRWAPRRRRIRAVLCQRMRMIGDQLRVVDRLMRATIRAMSDGRALTTSQLPWLEAVEDEDEPRGISARKMLAALLVVLLAAAIVAGDLLLARPPGHRGERPARTDPGRARPVQGQAPTIPAGSTSPATARRRSRPAPARTTMRSSTSASWRRRRSPSRAAAEPKPQPSRRTRPRRRRRRSRAEPRRGRDRAA